MRKIIAGAVVVVLSFFATLWATGSLTPTSTVAQPKLEQSPPLPPVTRTSIIVAPTSISLAAIRDALEAQTPRNFSNQTASPASDFLSKNEIGLSMARGPITVGGRADGLLLKVPVNGTLRVAGKLAEQAGKLTGAIGNLINQSVGQQAATLTNAALDQKADMRGDVAITARPQLTPQWRLEPNLSAQVTLDNNSVSVSGVKVSVAKEAKPLVDNVVDHEIKGLDARLRDNAFLENLARAQWQKMCRSVPLGGGNSGLPALWLELRPVRAFAAQPQIEPRNLIITMGVQAETRIVDKATTPTCPFPAELQIAPQPAPAQMRSVIAVPIDLPLASVSGLLEAQLKGHHFPASDGSPVDIQVLHASLAASGDRLLIALRVKASETKSWFGLGAEGNVYVWGRPELDAAKQIIRFKDVALSVESEAAFGLIGAAARAALPYLRDSLTGNAALDLKPILADARQKIGAALADFRQDNGSVRVDAVIQDLRLTGIEFDSKTLRLVTEATGTVRGQVNKLAGL